MDNQTAKPEIYLSAVVPIYNEKDNIAQLHAEIKTACQKLARPYEVIFINDGSMDGSLAEMKKLSPIKIISLRKNFGQTAALDAGIKEAKGELVATLDGDLQNDPADIFRLIAKMNEGYDVVSGWRKNRQDNFSKKFISRVANMLRQFMIHDGIHDSGCTLKVYKRECFATIDLCGEMHRFIPAMLKIKGFKVGELAVSHRPRIHGQAKYGWERAMKGFLDMMSVWFWKKFSSRPLHLFGTFGILLVFISIIAGAAATYQKIFMDKDLSDTALFDLFLFGFLIGFQFVVFGLISDMLSKTYYASSRDRSYIIKEIIERE